MLQKKRNLYDNFTTFKIIVTNFCNKQQTFDIVIKLLGIEWDF